MVGSFFPFFSGGVVGWLFGYLVVGRFCFFGRWVVLVVGRCLVVVGRLMLIVVRCLLCFWCLLFVVC